MLRPNAIVLLVLCLAACRAPSPTAASSVRAPDEPTSLRATISEKTPRFDYLEHLREARAEYERSDDKWSAVQLLSWHLSYVGEYGEAARLYSKELHNNLRRRPQPPNPDEAARSDFLGQIEVVDAVRTVCERAAHHQILIINEAHHRPEERAFGRSILPCLHEAGFTVLAVEALRKPQGDESASDYLAQVDVASFTNEPQMAGMLRDASSLGMKLISYDESPDCPKCGFREIVGLREKLQTDNLVERVFEAQPGARVVIWVGYSHAYKQPVGDPPIEWMAAKLWKRLGVEPYVVTQLSDPVLEALQPPLFEALADDASPGRPAFVEVSGPSWETLPTIYRQLIARVDSPGPPAFDGLTVHPRRDRDTPRYEWLLRPRSEQQFVVVACEACESSTEVLVQVYPAGSEWTTRVPDDQALCLLGRPCELVAPSGDYLLVIQRHAASSATVNLTLNGDPKTVQLPAARKAGAN